MQGFNNHTQGSYKTELYSAAYWRHYIAAGRNKTSRPIANNTSARLLPGGSVAIRLHDTDIVTVTDGNIFTLNSGGWLTVTTKERINRYSPASISQRAGVWYVTGGSLFYDGMQVDATGAPLKPKTQAATAAYENKLKRLKIRARKYAREYVAALKAGSVGMPSGADCWGCYFGISNSKNDSNPMGTGHLNDHMTEGYFVPSLIVNAAHAAGYSDMQCGLMGIGGQRVFIDPENVIYKYIVKSLQRDL